MEVLEFGRGEKGANELLQVYRSILSKQGQQQLTLFLLAVSRPVKMRAVYSLLGRGFESRGPFPSTNVPKAEP
jgi:hypothetical protein